MQQRFYTTKTQLGHSLVLARLRRGDRVQILRREPRSTTGQGSDSCNSASRDQERLSPPPVFAMRALFGNLVNKTSAFTFVLIMGAVNFFGDVTYEGGGSINGQYLSSLGATAAIISVAAGAGEFLGYALRSVAGYIADKTGRYWFVTFVGYVVNALAVPAMALSTGWQLAVVFVLLERAGRAIRKPTVEAMLSYTTGALGKGWVYGLNTALDEAGATLGPLVV